jgi:hypothetical protein
VLCYLCYDISRHLSRALRHWRHSQLLDLMCLDDAAPMTNAIANAGADFFPFFSVFLFSFPLRRIKNY